ncbi:MAG: hypothetical protein LWW85_00200 [Marinilabiliales bacterium]|nr:hypothetical protein [Marinilabiliales bacterium]
MEQLISYIALGAPATRCPASGELPFLRPEIGFTPKWYHESAGVDFGVRWHADPIYRRHAIQNMRRVVDDRFPGNRMGRQREEKEDLLTGIYGACIVSSLFDVPIRYAADQWPVAEHLEMTDEEILNLRPVDPSTHPFFLSLLEQVDNVADMTGKADGFLNWQGVLNNAQRLRGQQLFMDLLMAPELALHLFECITDTMIRAAVLFREHQAKRGSVYRFFTVSNCLVNMLSPDLYQDYLLPFDLKISEAFSSLGIHNCAWDASPYLDGYAAITNVSYVDMGQDSDLVRARECFPHARRAVMYTPMDLARKSRQELKIDLISLAEKFGPCDLVAADVEAGTPDQKVLDLISLCEEISAHHRS